MFSANAMNRRLRSLRAMVAALTITAVCAVIGNPVDASVDTAVDPTWNVPDSDSEIDTAALFAPATKAAGNRYSKDFRIGEAAASFDLNGGASDLIVLEVLHSGDSSAARSAVVAAGGTITGEVPGTLLQVEIVANNAAGLEGSAGILDVRRPSEAYPLYAGDPVDPVGSVGSVDPVDSVGSVDPVDSVGSVDPVDIITTGQVVGEHVAKTKAGNWHRDGYTGLGVRVGIIDFFGEPFLSNAISSGDLPEPTGTFCRLNGRSCQIADTGLEHGVAVGEVIFDAAPGVELFLATALSTADLQAAVDYFIENDVDIITRSLTSQYDGPGDGTGPMADVINYAVDNGITWFNSAGNNAGSSDRLGSYYRAEWRDDNQNGWHEFAPGDESMGFAACFLNGLRWSDWGDPNATDYDWYVYDNPSGTGEPRFVSLAVQGNGQDPLETVAGTPCGTVLYMKIRLSAANNGTAGDVLEVMGNGAIFEYWQNQYSATGPAVDIRRKGHVSVGAIDPPGGKQIALYSSQGPTNDGRIAPEIVAAACLSTRAYGFVCFNGTSSSTPAAAGAAALAIAAGIVDSPAEVEKWLLAEATVDRASRGRDNLAGYGELVLPALKCNGRSATILGSPGRDSITGTAGDDVILSFGGNDTIRSGDGDDAICSGSGKDKVFAGPGDDYVNGGRGRDRLDGGTGGDSLFGGRHRDVLRGRRGSDLLVGGSGGDVIDGGKGSDTCHFFTVENNKQEGRDRTKRCELGS